MLRARQQYGRIRRDCARFRMPGRIDTAQTDSGFGGSHRHHPARCARAPGAPCTADHDGDDCLRRQLDYLPPGTLRRRARCPDLYGCPTRLCRDNAGGDPDTAWRRIVQTYRSRQLAVSHHTRRLRNMLFVRLHLARRSDGCPAVVWLRAADDDPRSSGLR